MDPPRKIILLGTFAFQFFGGWTSWAQFPAKTWRTDIGDCPGKKTRGGGEKKEMQVNGTYCIV